MKGHLLSLGRIFLVGFFVLLFPELPWAGPIHVGTISTEPTAEIKKFLPFARYLAKELQPEGIDQGKVIVANNISQMANFFRERKVDLYLDSPFPTLAVSRLSGSKFLLRRWKKGVAEYHSLIFAKNDGVISRLEDLRGKIVAFEEPFSSSGYFFPKVALMQEGFKLVPKRNVSDPVGPDEVGYVFSNDDENTMVWVMRGKVVAGAMDDQNYLREARGNINSLKVIYKGLPLPRHIVSYRADLSAKLVARIKETLTQMDQSEGGKKALQDFERTTKFDDIPESSMAPLLKATKFMDVELGLK